MFKVGQIVRRKKSHMHRGGPYLYHDPKNKGSKITDIHFNALSLLCPDGLIYKASQGFMELVDDKFQEHKKRLMSV